MTMRGWKNRARVAAAALGAGMCALSAHAEGATNAGVITAVEIPEAVNNGAAWRIKKPYWDAKDEAGYAAFVQAIGRSGCETLGDCLAHKANPYRETDKRRYSGDCADMAYILRAYYAWKNGLVFSYQNVMRTSDGAREDIRYSTNGNVVAARRRAVAGGGVSAPGFVGRIGGEVSTAMFRTHPEKGGGPFYDDFYPVKIERGAVRPGVIAYDIFGHVGIVYDITEDGRILIVASHPDNSVTRTIYGPNFMRSKPSLGAGLKAWRPIQLEGATRSEAGNYIGGRIVAAKNSEIADYSMEQYFGNVPHPSGIWHYGEFKYDGRTLGYYDYVRRSLAAPGFAYNPVEELRHGLKSLCTDVRARKIAVQRATDAAIHLQKHPARLPRNIYGTYGLWENYSTPSRDARLKVSFIELRRSVQDLIEREAEGDPSIAYDGENLTQDLLEAFDEEAFGCKFHYWRSDGKRVRLTLANVMQRLWDLSFDPYHCPERRWGARGVELSSCTDNEYKERWYNAQRFLRNQAQRTYDVRMDFTVDELQAPMLASPARGGLGVEEPADADIRAYLQERLAPPPQENEAGRLDAAFRLPAGDV